MSEVVVARRYARALFELAAEKNILDQIGNDLTGVNQTLEQSDEFRGMFLHPQIEMSVKKQMIRNIFEGKVSEYVLSLIQLLIDRRRETIFADVAQQFVEMSNEVKGIVDATVFSAVALNAEELDGISKQFGQKVSKTLQMQNVVDSSIIGGLVIRIGDRIYDGGIKGKLTRFRQSLA